MQGDGTRDDNHFSETALDCYDFDAVIDNDGSIEDLTEKLHKVLSQTYILD
jgi:dephospho-CoA kinase